MWTNKIWQIQTIVIVGFIISISSSNAESTMQLMRVVGESMQPTILSGSTVVVDKILYQYIDPAVGDIVAIQTPSYPLLKRIVATEGDHVVSTDKGIIVNGKHELPLNNGRQGKQMQMLENQLRNYDYKLPINTHIVLGDNKKSGHSIGSNTFGMVSTNQLLGIVTRVIPKHIQQ